MSLTDNKSILNRIDQLRLESDSILLERQKSHIPCVYDILLEMKDGYYYEGTYYGLDKLPRAKRENTKIYLSKDIPFTFSNVKEKYIDTLVNLVAKNKIVPFMIFANGIFIKWSNITIVRDEHYSYIIISGLDMITDKENIAFECILLPCAIRYGEDGSILNIDNESMKFYFDVDGKLTSNPFDVNTRIEIIDKSVTGYSYNTFTDNLIKLSTSKHGQITNIDNIIPIINNRFDFAKLNDITEIGHSYFKCNTSLTGYKIFSYTYNKLESSNSLEYTIGDKDKVDAIIDQSIRNNTTNSTLELINNRFNFTYDKSKSFVENITTSLNYITRYDPRLMDSVYKKNVKIITKSYTGQELLDMVDDEGIVTMLRMNTTKDNNYIMIFVNNLIYRFHSRVKYTNNKVSFPLVNIQPDDNIEIVFFTGVNNDIAKITITESDSNYIDSRFDINNCSLYCDQMKDPLFNIKSETNGIQNNVPFSFTTVDKNTYKITLNDPFYYRKELTISNPNQFRYVHYNAFKDMVGFLLPEEFAFCRDKSRYLVFIDGRRISNDYIELVENDEDTPIFDFSLYTKIPLYKGSYIDIFYLPYSFDSITVEDDTLDCRDIIIDTSKLSYRLNNYAYLYFINGKKIHQNEIINLTANKVRLNIDPESELHLVIQRHIDPIEGLTDLFMNSDYDSYIDSLSSEELDNIMGGISNITNTETDIYNETINHRQLIYEIVRDYYMNGDLGISDDAFIYEYDDSIISETDKDPEQNYVIRLSDASYEDKANLYGVFVREEL